MAASAPVWQFSVDCGRFSNVTTSTFKKADPQCPTLISKSWDAINQLAKTEKGLLQLTDIFNLCEPLKNGDDLKSWLSDIYVDVAMSNYPYPVNFLSILPGK